MTSHKLLPYYFRGFVMSLKDYTETVPQKKLYISNVGDKYSFLCSEHNQSRFPSGVKTGARPPHSWEGSFSSRR